MKKFPKLNLSLPRLTFKDTPINAYLVYTLVIFAFLLGMLTNKVMYLEKAAANPPAAAAGAAANPNQPPPAPAVVEGLDAGKLPPLGNLDAKVTMIEFSDFQCPFCKKYFDEAYKDVYEKYVKTGKVKFAYRHFPLTSIHPNAQKAAEAAECANEQGKFWEFHDTLFKNQDTWAPKPAADAETDWVTYAGELGMNTSQFQSCVDTEKYKKNVDDDAAVATSQAQVEATPTFFINGTRLVGAVPFAEIQKIVDEELKK